MESELLFKRPGYEYRYRFGIDEEMISSYREQIRCSIACYGRSFILEVRTNFILKPSSAAAGEEVIASERFADILPAFLDDIKMYLLSIEYRLEEYWLPQDEIKHVADEALSFVKRTAADRRYSSLHVIPVVLHMDICTVRLQGEGEFLDAMIIRAIKPDYLIPFQVWGFGIVLAEGTRQKGLFKSKETSEMCTFHRMYLRSLPKERVKDVGKGLARCMELCPVCSEAPTYGTQISRLPGCGHVFHNHCIVRWLMNTKECPVCHLEISIEKPPLA